jgi:hypothetical protein
MKKNFSTKKLFFFGVLKVIGEKKQNPDPDPFVRGMDPYQNVMNPQHWITQGAKPRMKKYL